MLDGGYGGLTIVRLFVGYGLEAVQSVGEVVLFEKITLDAQC